MANLTIVLLSVVALCSGLVLATPLESKVVTIQATDNNNVPSIIYVVDAIQTLEAAYEVFDNDVERAEMWAALFNEKHAGTWDVVVGYSAYYLQKDSVYIEASVTGGKASKAVLFMIFQAEK